MQKGNEITQILRPCALLEQRKVNNHACFHAAKLGTWLALYKSMTTHTQTKEIKMNEITPEIFASTINAAIKELSECEREFNLNSDCEAVAEKLEDADNFIDSLMSQTKNFPSVQWNHYSNNFEVI